MDPCGSHELRIDMKNNDQTERMRRGKRERERERERREKISLREMGL